MKIPADWLLLVQGAMAPRIISLGGGASAFLTQQEVWEWACHPHVVEVVEQLTQDDAIGTPDERSARRVEKTKAMVRAAWRLVWWVVDTRCDPRQLVQTPFDVYELFPNLKPRRKS